MDIANATAAGPSYGILDVIFGSKSAESKEADGQELAPFMNLIKALKEKSEDKENAGSWTDEETASGKSAVDYRAVGMPGMFPPQAGSMEQLAASAQAMELAAKETASMPKLKTIDPKLVNGMLEASSLLPLTKEEQNLLSEVNQKIEQQNATLSKLQATKGLALAGGELSNHSEAANVLQDPGKLDLLRALNRKGLDPEGIKGAESSGQNGALDKAGKFLSTESYLQMHDQIAKAGNKSSAGDKQTDMDNGQLPIGMSKDAKMDSSFLTGDDKAKDFLGNSEKNLLSEMKPGRASTKLDPSLNFAAGLLGAQNASDSQVKDIQLPSANPTEMRGILTGEVNQGVSLQALKGGGEMRLIIHPEQLGEVKLHVGTKDGKVEVKITAENEEVAKVIRSGSKELEASLKDQNLSLTKFDVSVADGVASLDNGKGSLTDQFLQQQNPQNSLSNMFSRDDGQSSRWDNQNSHGNARDGSGGAMAQENENRRNSSSFSKQTERAKDSSRKLDVVA